MKVPLSKCETHEQKILAVDFDEFFVPDNTKKAYAQWDFDKATRKGNVLRMGKLIYAGLFTKYYLHEFDNFINGGSLPEADKAARDAYDWYDEIIKGVPESELIEFSEEYAKNFSDDGIAVLKELHQKDWKIYLISGAIDKCVNTILEKNGVNDLFEGVYCNTLDAPDGIIKSLNKENCLKFVQKPRCLQRLGLHEFFRLREPAIFYLFSSNINHSKLRGFRPKLKIKKL